MSNLNRFVDDDTRQTINTCVRTTINSLAEEQALIADTPNSRFQRLLQAFVLLKPLFLFLTTFPLIPQLWRSGIEVIVKMLESLVAIGPDVTVEFKAGRDL